MHKLFKYFKKYWLSILVCIVLVFIQSQGELSLPDYMSNIVTNGIQAGGFYGPVSEVLEEDTYNHILLFSSDSEAKTIKESYEYKDNINDNKFPKLKKGYVLKNLTNKQEDELSDALIKPMLIVYSIDNTSQKEIKEKYGNTSIYKLVQSNTKIKETIINQVDKQIDAMGESTIMIACGNSVKTIYSTLGCNIDSIQTNYIITSGLKMLGIAFLVMVVSMLSAYVSSKAGAGLARDLRKAVFEKVEHFSNTEFNKFSTASLITRTTNDITQVQQLMIMMLRIMLFAPMMGIGALIKAITNSPSMTWIIGMILLVIIGILIITMIVVLPKFRIIQSLIDKLNLTMRENLSGVLVIRAFGNEKISEERFDKANDDLTKVNLFVNRSMAILMPIMTFIMNIATVLVVWQGSKQLDLGNIAIGQMMAFIQYAMHIIMSFLFVAMIFIMFPRASVAASRISEVLETELSIKDPNIPQPFDSNKKGLVEFKDVSFTYPGSSKPVIENISFKAYPGKTTAFIGSTGSGKSTIINLIPRFYDATSGSVLVDGVNVKDVKMHNLREVIGLVPQKSTLFSGTIESNIKYGNNSLNEQQLQEVLTVSQSKEFIDNKELGIKEEISQGGTNVSGGQKQRLTIARAIAKNPEVLIFDDSFSALDFKTDAMLRKELSNLKKKYNNTVLIVGQRIASIMDADEIIVLDEGKIVGKGTHQELLKNCNVYREIAYSQLSKEELEDA